MAIDLNAEEIKILDKADDDIALYGKTDEKCPRCRNEIIIEEIGKSYSVRCKTENCISLDYRGI